MTELKDRVSAKPGRFLLKPESGAGDFYATLEMADEPSEPGTKVNRQNVIDTLLPESENGGVGTVIYTAAKNVDDRWLLCDGSEVKAAVHPELYGVLQDVPLQARDVRTYKVCDKNYEVTGTIKYINGYYVVCMLHGIAYAQNLAGPWSYAALSGFISDVIYANGYWVAMGNGNIKPVFCYYAKDIAGPWTEGFRDNIYGGTQIFYANGTFYTFAHSHNYAEWLYKATSPDSWEGNEVSQEGTFSGVVYSKTHRRWYAIALTGDQTAIRLCVSADMENWQAVGSKITLTDVISYSSIYYINLYLGIDEKYINVVCNGWVISVTPDGNVAKVSDILSTSQDFNSVRGLCDGKGEMIVGRIDVGVEENYFRNTSDGDFIKAEEPPLYHSRVYTPVVHPTENGEVLLPGYQRDEIFAFNGIYNRVRPSITVPDTTGQVQAYIKAK